MTFGCDSSSCVAQSCDTGYKLDADRCIDSDWSVELVDASADYHHDNQPRSAAVDVGPAGMPYIAYVDPPNIKVAHKTSGGWLYTSTALGEPGLTAVTDLEVDALGNAHVIYYSFKSISFHEGTYAYRYAKISPAGVASLTIEFGTIKSMWAKDGVALAVDASGDAHVAYNLGGLKYRRTYQGAWLGAVTVSSTDFGYPSIAVDGSGTVHVAGVSGTNFLYSQATASVFSAPLSALASSTTAFTEMQLFVSGSTVELWGKAGRNFHRASVSGSALSTPTLWGALPGTPSYVTGARGPMGFSMIEQSSSNAPVTARSGPPSGPTLVETTNLPLSRLEKGSVVDSSGTIHSLSWKLSSGSGDALYYVRGH